jgi:hypothetical protein
MRYLSLFALFLGTSTAVFGQDDDAKARTLAQQILDRGAALFDKRDAVAIAATYVEDAQAMLIKREGDARDLKLEVTRGRAEIEKVYARIFKDRLPEHRCRNTVESARFLGPEMLLIQGRFALDRNQSDVIQFVQIRARQGEEWKIVTLQLMLLPGQNP